MPPELLWGLVLLAVALALTALEVFLTSAGLIAIVAALCATAGIYFLFKHDTGWGLGGLLGALVLMPSIFFGGLQLWTNTRLGRRMMGMPLEEELEARREAEFRAKKTREAMIGRKGVVLTDLRPVGTVDFDGERVDAIADTGYIPAGSEVKVVGLEPTEVRVRKI